MSYVEVWVKEGNPVNPAKPKRWLLSLRDDLEMTVLLNELIPKLGLPTQQQDGRRIAYRLHHEQSGHTISRNETLSGAGVRKNDVCVLFVEPGRGHGHVPRATLQVASKSKKVKSTRLQKSDLDRVRKFIAEQFSVDEDRITPGTSLVDDLEADELDILEFLTQLEDELNISIPDQDLDLEYLHTITVQTIIDYLK